MELKKLKLLNFRNHEKFQENFDKTTILLGANATGKTSVIEAIYLLSTSKSFRVVDIGSLIFFDAPFTKISGQINDENRDLEIDIIIEKEKSLKKTLRIDGKKQPLVAMLGRFLAVLFTPETLSIVLGSPSLRRRSLDILLCSISKKYAVNLLEFLKILRQRNRLLYLIKERNASSSGLEAWNKGFVEKSRFLQEKRKALLLEMNNFLRKSLRLFYYPSPQEDIEKKLIENFSREKELGFTLEGPQKDDFVFNWQGRSLSLFGSRGEIREATILYKLAEWDFMRQKTGCQPVLLLDDMFSELDREKRQKIEELINKGQTILTTTSLSLLSPKIIKEAKVIELRQIL